MESNIIYLFILKYETLSYWRKYVYFEYLDAYFVGGIKW